MWSRRLPHTPEDCYGGAFAQSLPNGGVVTNIGDGLLALDAAGNVAWRHPLLTADGQARQLHLSPAADLAGHVVATTEAMLPCSTSNRCRGIQIDVLDQETGAPVGGTTVIEDSPERNAVCPASTRSTPTASTSACTPEVEGLCSPTSRRCTHSTSPESAAATHKRRSSPRCRRESN